MQFYTTDYVSLMLMKASCHAERKGGKCLSQKCDSKTKKLNWQCAEGHQWRDSYQAVMQEGRWCPECKRIENKAENRVRRILEGIFQTFIKKQRPVWNVNPETNRPLELDGYSADLKIAFEYQGPHHYVDSKKQVYNYTLEQIEYQVRKDGYKRNNCAVMGVNLIEIPHISKYLNENVLLEHVKICLYESGIDVSIAI